MRTDGPIGMFDSGFGGLTVARAVIDLLPDEDLVYLGDTARYPYGSRSQSEVLRFSVEIATHLVERHGIKMLVVACNTATAAALDHLTEVFDIPVLGVIEPGVRALLSAGGRGPVGVIGTVGTVGSGVYQRLLARLAPTVSARCWACPGFVEFVERGVTSGPEITVLAERLLQPVSAAGTEALLLGCTHYPYLARVISDVVGRHVVLVSSADETAFAVADLLADTGLGRRPGSGSGAHRFLSSGDVGTFTAVGGRLFGPELVGAERWAPPSSSGEVAPLRLGPRSTLGP